MNAATQLAQHGITTDQARAWIMQHLDQPETIYNTAVNHGLDSAMLAEIVSPDVPGANQSMVEQFFAGHGLDANALAPQVTPDPTPTPVPDTNEPLPDFLPGDESVMIQAIQGLVELNDNTGVLSTDSIRSQALQLTNQTAYNNLFDLTSTGGDGEDAIAVSDLSSLLGLESFEMTPQNMESLLYGTAINLIQSFDQQEITQLETFTTANEQGLASLQPETMDQFYQLMADIVSDPAEVPLVSDTELAQTLGFMTGMMANTFESGVTGIDDLLGDMLLI